MAKVIAGRFELRDLIAKGGVAEIYEAYDRRLKIKVVVKLPRRDVSFNASRLLENEAWALSRLSHPYIIRLVDWGWHEGAPYVALEYFEGTPLSRLVQPPIDPASALDMVLDAADAIAYANRVGIAHRDIKPGNLLFSSRRSVLIDFSVSAPIGSRGPKAETPGYSCPEAARGEATPTCDAYSLAALLSWLTSGDPLTPAGPYAWILAACLAEDPGARPWRVQDLITELRKVMKLGPRVVVGFCSYALGRRVTLTVGRSETCDVQIDDPHRYLDPVHAVIVLQGSYVMIEDRDSLNGVFLYRDGQFVRVRRAILGDGDVVALCYSKRKGPYALVRYWSF